MNFSKPRLQYLFPKRPTVIWIQPAFPASLITNARPPLYIQLLKSIMLPLLASRSTYMLFPLSHFPLTKPLYLKNDLFFISQLRSVPLSSLLWPFLPQDVRYTCYFTLYHSSVLSSFCLAPILKFLFNFKSREKLQWFILYSYWPINLHFALFNLPLPPIFAIMLQTLFSFTHKCFSIYFLRTTHYFT